MIGAKLSASSANLRASIAVVDARADITCVVPVVAVSYIYMKVRADLDAENRNPFVTDSYVVLDSAVLAVAKALNDTQQITDKVGLVNSISKQDVVGVSDTVSTLLIFIRNFADTFGLTDSQTIDAAKNLFEQLVLSDSDTYNFSKFIPDGVAMQDGADVQDGNVHHFEKYVMNMAFMSDANQKFLEKMLTDASSVEDLVALHFSRPLADSFGFTDTDIIDTALFKSEDVIPTDTLTSAFSKQISPDSIAFLDQIVKNPGKGLSDSAAPDDTGYLYAQNYCDITYFLEDYVGEYRTFT